eukprot:TRINITY_DN72865_c0_g1_i1.p1 TRINITY_DN72865_c0_g1~~TRINITY_DN72865_c0_g1_i1.p1  ORF type:complete len:331 (-),score=47.09 TRINITY_DN72865_c0_g1_i1:199-1191(-)
MDAKWRAKLELVLDAPTLEWLETETAREVADAAEDAAQIDLFESPEPLADDLAAQQIKASEAALEAVGEVLSAIHPPLTGLGPEDVPSLFRAAQPHTAAYFRVVKVGADLSVPVAFGTAAQGHGDVVWAAAEYTADVFWTGKALQLIPKAQTGGFSACRVLEVGAGVGLPSATALRCGANVLCTDLESAVRLRALATTLALNLTLREANDSTRSTSTARVAAHNWGSDCSKLVAAGKADFIVCCDCLYMPEFHTALLDTFTGCLADDGVVFICFSLHGNAPDDAVFSFFDVASGRGFSVEKFEETQMPSRCSNMPLKRSYVYAYTLRRQS